MTVKLKGCPFCGSHNLVVDSTPLSISCACLDCGAESGLYGSVRGLVKDWNTRKDDGKETEVEIKTI